MQWPEPPYPPGYQPPGVVFFLLVGLVMFCFVGIVLYVAFACRATIEAQRNQDSSSESLNREETGEEDGVYDKQGRDETS